MSEQQKHRQAVLFQRATLTLAVVALTVGAVFLPALDDASARGFASHGGGGGGGHFAVEHSKGAAHSFRNANTSRSAGRTGRYEGHNDGHHEGRYEGGKHTSRIYVPPRGGKQGGKGGTTTASGGDHGGPRWPGRQRGPGHPWPNRPIGPIGSTGTGVVVNNPVTSGSSGGLGGAPSNSGSQSSNSTPQVTKRAGTGAPPNNERRYVPDEVVIEVAGNFSDQAANALALRHRLARLQMIDLQLTGTRIYRWRIPDRRTVPQVVRALEADGAVLSAQPNYIATLMEGPAPAIVPSAIVEDPSQYAPDKLNVPQAHELATGDHVLVAVVDSGIDTSHPELAGMIAGSFDAVEASLKARPLAKSAGPDEKIHPHGTGIAGAIVAHAKMMGIAPAARILAVRSFAPNSTSSEGTTVSIEEGIDWAAAHGARVINMSFAGPEDPGVARSIAAAHDRGIVMVAASGNNGPNAAPQYPAANPNVIAVAATDADDKLFSASVRGKHIAVAAPGVEIYLPSIGGTYQIVSGTSFSAAEVSGAVALMIERKPDVDPETVRRTLMATARDLGPKGVDPMFGAGLVDAYKAVLALEPAPAGAAVAAGPEAAPVIPASDRR